MNQLAARSFLTPVNEGEHMNAKWIIGTLVATISVSGIFLLLMPAPRTGSRVAEPAAAPSELENPSAPVSRSRLTRTQKDAVATPSASTAAPVPNLLTRLSNGEQPPRLNFEQADAFASQNQRRPEALLAAFHCSGDASFIREAMEKFPTDPRVAYAAATLDSAFNSPEEAAKARRGWLDRFKESAPDNALANYLSAREHFKAGEREAAVAEVLGANNKPYRDYSIDSMQNTEEAFRAAGYSDAEAKAIASTSLLLPQLAQMRDVGKQLVELSKEYRAQGDEPAAQALLHTAATMGARLDSPGTLTLLQSLVGVAIQQHALRSLDPAAAFGAGGQTVQAQLDQLLERRAVIRSAAQQFDQLTPRLSDQDLVNYFDRLKLCGDEAALRWVTGKYRQ
jgi:hypothetical protein